MSNCYLNTNDKTLCTGCRACEQICLKKAISMAEDDEGYIYPVIDDDICVGCDLCRKVCPINASPEMKNRKEIYAAQTKNKDELKNSTSGGVFITLAKNVIKNNGVVFGCVIDEEFNVKIISAEKYEELISMQGSKYVQADTGETFKETKEYLEQGRQVLYTGAPCQIAGLKKYLGKEYDNLITVDFLCHGVPSNKLFKEDVKYLSDKYKGEISDYKFRDKRKKGWCKMTSFITKRGRKIYQHGRINAFANAFTLGAIDRLCCYKCRFAGTQRCSDITIGDFWGVRDVPFDMYKGTSFLMINNDKGHAVIEKVKSNMIIVKKTLEEAYPENAGSLNETERNNAIPSLRSEIYRNINNYKSLADGILRPKSIYLLKIKQNIPIFVINHIRGIRQIMRRK